MTGMMRLPPTQIDLSNHQATVFIILRRTNHFAQKPPNPRILNRTVAQAGELETPLDPRYDWSAPTPNPDRGNRQVRIGVEKPDPSGESTCAINGVAFRSQTGLQAGLEALDTKLTEYLNLDIAILRNEKNDRKVTVERTHKDGDTGPTGRLIRIAVHDTDVDKKLWIWWEILEVQIY
ncbi:hypothetical protein HBI24_178680 [Parastagonospora nodorum]|nr:hypothetical protein HBI75_152100 [Parastagonospora nodorum]KAH5577258.1 hypothetical protein HBI24_178680 [Parastagonospora nodorum]KAH5777636.1 hypothetical protein HBI97_129960 [Parastagonospora nodorum]KAH5793533.1 hypothetical protein HBI96_188090 [Parastagonospora nodorum]KAH5806607.1 hypothetical protein HBI94_175760 [Parastagonospora nodorum]